MKEHQTNKYDQIVDYYQNMIVSRELLPKQKLSSIRDSAKSFSVSITTAQKAYQILIESNICYAKYGNGTFVSQGARDIIVNNMLDNFELSLDNLRGIGLSESEIINIISKI